MRLKFTFTAMIIVAALVLASCNAVDNTANTNSLRPSGSPEANTVENARRITTAELETLIKEGKAFVVDVRSQDSYDKGHIPGSKLIPVGEIANHINELPRDKTIVTYCS